MKTEKASKKASAPKAPKTQPLNVNIDYICEIADESIATLMALRALVIRLSDELREARK